MPKTASQEGFGCLGVGVTGLILVKFHADTGDDHHKCNHWQSALMPVMANSGEDEDEHRIKQH